MQNIINILVFLIILGSIITVHELGHFLAAKFFGVYCSHFSIGFGPKIWSKKTKETEYEIRILPFGGFVAMAGEETEADEDKVENLPAERTLQGIQTYKKVIIFLAGVFMNFLLAFVVLVGVNLTVGVTTFEQAQIGAIIENSPAEVYNLQVGDQIDKVYVQESDQTYLIEKYEDLNLSRDALGLTTETIHVTFEITRNNETIEVPMELAYSESSQSYWIGMYQATRDLTFVEAFTYTFASIGSMSVMIFVALGQLVTQFASTIGQLSGPAGIYQITAEVTQTGQVAYILQLLAMLSVNIGIFNLLPIPGLDGCQVIFAVVEKIIGRDLPTKLKFALQIMGLGLVVLLMVIVTFQDIMRIFG